MKYLFLVQYFWKRNGHYGSRYKIVAQQISGFFSALLNQDSIVIENDQQIEQAIKWYDLGADFAGALHLSVCNTSPMYTFDKDFCKAAHKEGMTPVVKILDESGRY